MSDTMQAKESRRAKPLSPEQLGELLPLMKGADTVELKLSVPDDNRRSTVAALRMDPLDSQIRQVMFFDTPDLALNRSGVVVRARRVQGRDGDTVVKLRPVVPQELPPVWRESTSVGVEVDAMPGGFVCSASVKAKRDDGAVKAVFAGTGSVRKLLSKEQRAFFADHAPDGLAPDALTRLGPINVLKLKFTPEGLGRRLVAELWLYPDGTRLLELSTKCLPHEAFEVAAEVKVFLAAHGVDLLAEQQTKTRTALDFYAAELAAGSETATATVEPR
ncbi:adenylate cyclase [Occultella glacieicola]|uniref:Adenylate cyclase n=1 Tax=Occultella glacieicola TaxID=2518684 RepID=A0ABY2E257_9MICO|nr:adenylate cyclase [Occultella glacieicola]TDE92646.1 adenylate cyclase [Occultella glacieicola]